MSLYIFFFETEIIENGSFRILWVFVERVYFHVDGTRAMENKHWIRRVHKKYLVTGILYWYLILSVKETEITAVGIRHADHVAPSIHKSWH
jgi:hypothetical protein